jgi:type IV fimbrial biogenesis protein FimT
MPSCKCDPRAEAGFSVLELVIVGMVFVILSTVAVGAGGAALDSQRVHTSAGIVASALVEARMNAIKRNTTVWLAIDTANNQVQVQYEGPTDVGPAQVLATGVTFTGSPPATVAFNSLGRLTTSPVMVTLRSAKGRTRSVTVSAVGRIRTQ